MIATPHNNELDPWSPAVVTGGDVPPGSAGKAWALVGRTAFDIGNSLETSFFDEFALLAGESAGTAFRLRIGGSGPPLMLLHGHPGTHTTWWQIAPVLARTHTVVCPDLPGFGWSSSPKDEPGLPGASKRAKAAASVALMRDLGFERFRLVGHDRGGYTAFRAAMEWPDAVERMALLDTLPILETLERCDWRFAKSWWHWFFYAVEEKPEQAVLADPRAWYGTYPQPAGLRNRLDAEAAISREETIRSMIADYRAGITTDWKHDSADPDAGRQLQQPVLCLWSTGEDEYTTFFGDVLEIWRPWAKNLQGHSICSDHHMAEDAAAELAAALADFFSN